MQIETLQPTPKDHRIAARLTKEHKSLFERAATLKGLSLTDFMVSSAYDAALKILNESQILITLSPADSRQFFESLLHPRDADELPELQNALNYYRQQIES